MKVNPQLLDLIKTMEPTPVFAGNAGGELVLVFQDSIGYTEINAASYEAGASLEEADEFAMKLNTEVLGHDEKAARAIILKSQFPGADL